MTFNKLAVVLAAVAVSGTSFAATQDGNLGANSEGKSDVTIAKEDLVRLTGLAPIDFGSPGFLTAPLIAAEPVCVGTTTGQYSVIASSRHGFQMRLDDAAGNTAADDNIPYLLTWTNAADAAAAINVVTTFTTVDTDLSCGATGSNAVITVTVPADRFNSASKGNFTDEITLTVSSS